MITETKNGLERILKFRPAFHKVNDTDPKQDFGVHGVELHFVIKGPKGAVHFIMYTNMMLKKTREWWKITGRGGSTSDLFPMGVDVGYHSPTKMFEGQEVVWPTKMRKKDPDSNEVLGNYVFDKIGDEPPICEYIGVPCYSDGSAIRSDEWTDIFLEEGDDKIWEMLEEDYKTRFEKEKHPNELGA